MVEELVSITRPSIVVPLVEGGEMDTETALTVATAMLGNGRKVMNVLNVEVRVTERDARGEIVTHEFSKTPVLGELE